MIKTKILLILGAGASAPFGFPLGRGLRNEIWNMLAPPPSPPAKGQKVIGFYQPTKNLQFLMEAGRSTDRDCDLDYIQEFREAMLKSGRFSVDAFLEHRSDDFGTVGKRAIVIALRQYEDPKIFERLTKENENNWYELLVEALIEDVPFEKFSELSGKNLAIVTFNYDRSLEYYLHERLIHNYGITSTEAAEKINEIEIIHVHGKLGDLPWQKDVRYKLPYKKTINSTIVEKAAENIKIIPTAQENTPEFEQARDIIKWADRIFLLGFGFDKQNLKRLQLGPLRKEIGGVSGTGKGLRFRDFNTISVLGIRNLAKLHRRRFTEPLTFPFPNKTIYEYLWDDIDLTE